jgi:hypothetical protein
MTTEEFKTKLRECFTRQPFVPFRVDLVDGESFIVDRRDAAGHNGTYHSAGFIPADGPPYFFDARNVIAMTPLTDAVTAVAEKP